MPNDDQPDNGNPDQGKVNEEQDSSLPVNPDTSGGGKDPLDEITDIEVLRGEAKKHRSIAQRNKPKPAEAPPADPTPPANPAPQGGALTKADLHRINSDKARKMLRSNADMAPHADEILKAYANRRGLEDPEEIFEDLKDAWAVVKSRQAPKENNPAVQLQTDTVQRPSGSKPLPKEGRQTQRILTKPASMKEWFQKPQS